MKKETIPQNNEGGEGVPVQLKILIGIMALAFFAIIVKLSIGL